MSNAIRGFAQSIPITSPNLQKKTNISQVKSYAPANISMKLEDTVDFTVKSGNSVGHAYSIKNPEFVISQPQSFKNNLGSAVPEMQTTNYAPQYAPIQPKKDSMFSSVYPVQNNMSKGGLISGGGGSMSKKAGPLRYGFVSNDLIQSVQRGSLLRMSATPEGKSAQTDDSSSDIVSAEKTQEECVDQAEINKKNYNPIYAFFVLFVVLICRIVVQWHRKGLTYAYGYTGLGEAANNGFYEMATYFPELKIWYGLLAGVIYTIPYAGFGLIAGKLSDGADRRLWLGIVVLLASLTMGASYFTGSFAVLACMRIIHGCLNSASNPLSFSLIADYFPPDKRSTANSIIQAGNYIGVGVSSISILLISKFGWQATYGIMGLIGGFFAIATMLFVKEPARGRYLDEATKRKEAEKKAKAEAEAKMEKKNPIKAFIDNVGVVFTLPTARNVLIASSLRNFGGMIVSSFLPVFFGRNFPGYKAEYAYLNALALSVGGLVASLAGGIMADKLEKKSYMSKAMICISGCILSVPLIALGTLTTGNFYLSVLCYALKVLVSGTYSGPAITMIQNTSPQSQQGNAVSVYFFAITAAQTLSPAIFGYLANAFGCLSNPALYGPIITAFVALSYLGSVPFWWQAGKEYKKYMDEKDAQECLIDGKKVAPA